METELSSKAFRDEMRHLREMVVALGDLTTDQLSTVSDAVVNSDATLASRVVEREPQADHLEHQIDDMVVRVLALRHPVAIDLRAVLCALRIANELERICDHAKNMAQRLIAVRAAAVEQRPSLANISRFAVAMVRDVMDAYKDGDLGKAVEVWNRDEELDRLYSAFFKELLDYEKNDPTRISAFTHLLFMARDIERIGDRATNIAEMVRFMITGTAVKDERRKADTTKSLPATST